MLWLRIHVEIEIFRDHFHSLRIVLHHSHSIVLVLRYFLCTISFIYQLISFTLFVILSITRLKGIEPFPCRILVIIGSFSQDVSTFYSYGIVQQQSSCISHRCALAWT